MLTPDEIKAMKERLAKATVQELFNYLYEQFPSTRGNVPLKNKLDGIAQELDSLRRDKVRYKDALVRVLNFPVHSEPIGCAMAMQEYAADALVPCTDVPAAQVQIDSLRRDKEVVDWLQQSKWVNEFLVHMQRGTDLRAATHAAIAQERKGERSEISTTLFDLWVGVYWDAGHRTLYICPLPTVVLRFEFSGNKDESKHRTDRRQERKEKDE